MTIPNVKHILGDALHAAVEFALKEAFPSAGSSVSEAHVAAYAYLVWKNLSDNDAMKILGVPKPDQTVIDQLFAATYVQAPPDGFTYYVADAKHSRVIEPTHSFTGHLPLVRVPLALTDAQASVITTAIGTVEPADHLFQSVEQLSFKYASELGYTPARADVVTPARSHGSRFSAIALYLGYKNVADVEPSFYVLESGTATGTANMAFVSLDMKPIPARKKWYSPTPFTGPNAHYTGDLQTSGDEIVKLHVEAFSDVMVHEVTVDVTYKRCPPVYVWPALLTVQAAGRVGAISVKMGKLNLEDLFAPIGFALDWDQPLK